MSDKQTVNIRSRNKDVIIALNQLIYLVLFRINYNPIMIWKRFSILVGRLSSTGICDI